MMLMHDYEIAVNKATRRQEPCIGKALFVTIAIFIAVVIAANVLS